MVVSLSEVWALNDPTPFTKSSHGRLPIVEVIHNMFNSNFILLFLLFFMMENVIFIRERREGRVA